jgi:hypothetical protein
MQQLNWLDWLRSLSKSFYEALLITVVQALSQSTTSNQSKYPFILVDDYIPIQNPRLGQSVGSLSVTVAIGTPVQIQRLEQKEKEPI